MARYFLTCVSLVLALGACAGGEARPDPEAVVRVAIGEPGELVPAGEAGPDGAQVLAALFTPLVGLDAQGRPYGLAAASVTPDPEHRVWTVRLREGFTFHDGEPVTADSYLDAWNHGARQPGGYALRRIDGYPAVNPADGARPTATRLRGLAKLDDRTFTISLAEPFTEFASVLAAPAFYPLPRAAFESPGRFAHTPIGNGPFRIVERHTDRIETTRYQAYPGPRPPIGGLTFTVYSDPSDAYADLLAGRVDLVNPIPLGNLATVESDLGDRYLRLPSAAFQFLAFPAHHTELADPEVRQAISMAIDRDEIATGIFRGTRVPARGFAPPVVPGARAGTCGAVCEFDPVAARLLYQRAGGPARLAISYNADGEHREWVAAVCDQLQEYLGVACEARVEPSLGDLLDKVDAQEPVGMLRQSWVMDYPSLESYLGPLYASDGSANVYGYLNPQVDALVDAAAAATSAPVALATYQQAETIVARDLPVIPLWFGTHPIGHSERVHGIAVTPMGTLDLTGLTVSLSRQ